MKESVFLIVLLCCAFKMWDQSYYYTDSSFQLDINLQTIRRSLIQAIDDFESEDCSRCKRLKCRCDLPVTSSDSGQDSDDQASASEPPDVPRSSKSAPELNYVGAWVIASTPTSETESPGSKKISWPPAPNSQWIEDKEKIKMETSRQSNVQEFFKFFNDNMGNGTVSEQNRALMNTLKFMAGKPSEYSYF